MASEFVDEVSNARTVFVGTRNTQRSSRVEIHLRINDHKRKLFGRHVNQHSYPVILPQNIMELRIKMS